MDNPVFFSLIELQSHLQLITKNYSTVVCITDSNTAQHCFPLLNLPFQHITIAAGEVHKNIHSCTYIWEQLTDMQIDRKALLLSLGGGMVTDLGSFAAVCYKRGVAHINIPTSLLAMVDASVGGKTGIDFKGYKNQIGLFDFNVPTLICTEFLTTLPQRELRSGYIELLKHYLISNQVRFEQCYTQLMHGSLEINKEIIEQAVAIKMSFVRQDPTDTGIRKVLNFGHTVGHAVESAFLDTPTPLLHGEAVGIGIIAEAYISFKRKQLTEASLQRIVQSIHTIVSIPAISVSLFPTIFRNTLHDKKNNNGVLCVLLDGIGKVTFDQCIDDNDILESLTFYNSTCEQYPL